MSDKKKKKADNVVVLNMVTRLDLEPDRVLKGAKGKLDECVIVGWDKDGDLYFASSQADGGDVLWLLEKAKMALLQVQV